MRALILSVVSVLVGCEAHLSLPEALTAGTQSPAAAEPVQPRATARPATALEAEPDRDDARATRARAEEVRRAQREEREEGRRAEAAAITRRAQANAAKAREHQDACSRSFPARLATAQSELRDAAAFAPQHAKMCAWVASHACREEAGVQSVRMPGGATITQRVGVVCSVMPAPYDEPGMVGCIQGLGPGGTWQLRPEGLPGSEDCSDVDPVRLEASGPDTAEGKAILTYRAP